MCTHFSLQDQSFTYCTAIYARPTYEYTGISNIKRQWDVGIIIQRSLVPPFSYSRFYGGFWSYCDDSWNYFSVSTLK